MTEPDPVAAASEQCQRSQKKADEDRAAFFDLCAQRVKNGVDTADTLAARSFPTAVTIRKELRVRGVEALPRGPKARKGTANG
ncbi:hypothetical protein [Streptosporangium sp. NPDC049078]|uniref:hypothetical protein n=1 Tax=Streptosporangium sp. NPDC049078 TaxID=3155767 RepID=UPI003424AFFA